MTPSDPAATDARRGCRDRDVNDGAGLRTTQVHQAILSAAGGQAGDEPLRGLIRALPAGRGGEFR